MQQKKICYFFCDIMGTFSTISEDKEQIKQFINNLICLKERLESDEFYFNFITSDNMELLCENIKKVKPYIDNNNIKFGSQFCEEAEINYQTKKINPINYDNSSRVSIIKAYIEKKGIHNIYMFFLADDALMNTEILKIIWSKMEFDNSKLITMNPNKEKSLNICLNEVLKGGIQGNNGQGNSGTEHFCYDER